MWSKVVVSVFVTLPLYFVNTAVAVAHKLRNRRRRRRRRPNAEVTYTDEKCFLR